MNVNELDVSELDLAVIEYELSVKIDLIVSILVEINHQIGVY